MDASTCWVEARDPDYWHGAMLAVLWFATFAAVVTVAHETRAILAVLWFAMFAAVLTVAHETLHAWLQAARSAATPPPAPPPPTAASVDETETDTTLLARIAAIERKKTARAKLCREKAHEILDKAQREADSWIAMAIQESEVQWATEMRAAAAAADANKWEVVAAPLHGAAV